MSQRSLAVALALAVDAVKVLMIHNAAEADAGFREALPEKMEVSKVMGVALVIIHDGIFPNKSQPIGGTPMSGKPQGPRFHSHSQRERHRVDSCALKNLTPCESAT